MHYLFGDYCLDTQRYELRRGNVSIPLRPKVYQVLAYLLTHYDRVVLKQELLEHVWPGQYVGDAALNSYIMDIRKALGDDGYGQRLLRTMCGRGYRFVAPVEVQDPVLPAPPSRLVPSPAVETSVHTSLSPPLPAEPLPAAEPTNPVVPYADGEHKLVTILCGALAEAPLLAAQLGPERWYRLLQTVSELTQAVLLPYAGPSPCRPVTVSRPCLAPPWRKRIMPGGRWWLPSSCVSACRTRPTCIPSSPEVSSASAWGCTRAGWWWVDWDQLRSRWPRRWAPLCTWPRSFSNRPPQGRFC